MTDVIYSLFGALMATAMCALILALLGACVQIYKTMREDLSK